MRILKAMVRFYVSRSRRRERSVGDPVSNFRFGQVVDDFAFQQFSLTNKCRSPPFREPSPGRSARVELGMGLMSDV